MQKLEVRTCVLRAVDKGQAWAKPEVEVGPGVAHANSVIAVHSAAITPA